MTEIRWKNGGPLFLQPAPGSDIGLVATEQDCCCPPPPPERCWCGGTCSYFIGVVEPLAVTASGGDCVSGNSNNVMINPSLLQAIVPIYPDGGDFVLENVSYAGATGGGGALSAFVSDVVSGFPTFLPAELYYFQLRARRSATISVFCVLEAEQPKYYATIRLSVSVRYVFESLGFTPLGSWSRAYSGTFEVPAACVVSPERECSPEIYDSSTEFLRIDTPLEITLSGDGTSSLGSLTMDSDSGDAGVPPEFPYAKDALDAILEETSYTFRITARENCLPLPDPCTVTIDGEPVDIRDIDPEVALDVEWTHAGRTLQVPDGQQTFDFWNGFSTGTDVTWHELYQLILESRAFKSWQLVAGEAPSLASWTPPGACEKWAVTALDATTCRIQGCVQTSYDEGTSDTGIRPYESTDYQIRALWRWTCDIVSGVQGAVTYELIESYRYEWDVATLSFLLVPDGDAGDEPVVTVTLAP